MDIDRREWLAGVAGLAASAAGLPFSGIGSQPMTLEGTAPVAPLAPGSPRRGDFALPPGYTYLNAAYMHPMPIAAAAAAQRYFERRTKSLGLSARDPAVDVKAEFAALINAKPSEISHIPNTSTGENLIVNGLGIRRFDGNVVTDALHFDGSLVNLLELQKQGLDLRMIPAHEGRIDLRDYERVVDKKTRLIEVSLVAMYNGFQPDLKAICDLAHAHGAYVYCDIIQAAGAVPIDVRASGVDFCAGASFKWLMGDFGLGFLYVREDLLDRVVARTQIGYQSTATMDEHFPPFDPEAAPQPVSWTMRSDATGHFEVGTDAYAAEAALKASLPYLRALGVENIQAYRQPLLRQIRAGMVQLGFPPVTPEGSTSPIITFAVRDGRAVEAKLQRANINARVSDYWIRLSPSIYNDAADVDRLLEALG